MTITVLRPSSASSFTGWSAQPSGTLNGVTSDDSDSTYALWSGSGSPLVLQTPIDSPPAGERRHQVRVRVRGEDGSAWWAVRLQNGALTAGASATFPDSPGTVNGSWGFGAPHDGPTILAAQILAQSDSVKITEVYVDMDSREAPTFTGQVVDGSGVVNAAITDTNTPTLRAFGIDSDGLTIRQYRFWVTQGSAIVWDSGILSGNPVDQLTTPLPNGSYTANLQIWSTLGASTPYASTVQTVAFTITTGDVPIPNDPTVNDVPGSPLLEISVCAPDVSDFDQGRGYVELQRIDCVGGEAETTSTIAMLGPLETDQCATWEDFTIPRTGLGANCTHVPEQCCSYYRARTIGRINGAVVISAWSDVRDAGIPRGLVFFWPGTNAGIPAGWKRTTALDGRYAKGVTSATAQPGTRGGSASHAHTTPGHSHDISHAHTVTGNTSAAVGQVTSTPNTAGSSAVPVTHTHTRSAVNSTTLLSGVTQPAIGTQPNDPIRHEVIYIESDGTPAGVPNTALSITGDVSLAGWTDFANATNRFMKGAAPGGDGGLIAATGLLNHVHTIGAHTHAAVPHTHTSPNTGNVAGSLTLTSGAISATYAATHNHPVAVGTSDAAALASGGSANSGTAAPDEPPFRTVRVKQNTSGGNSLPVGLIGAWRGSLGTIPNHWKLCDGTGGTPDLLDRYPKEATSSIGTAGGSLNTHTHTSPSHTHTTSGHTHTETIGVTAAASSNVLASSTIAVSTSGHTHTGSATDSTTPTVGASTSGILAAVGTEPLYETVAFVQLVEPQTVDPDPETFCFTWTEDEHLLRTQGPDGAMWAPVTGKFTWDVDRPMTASTGVNGTRFAQNGAPGERNLSMTAAVESEEDLERIREILARPLVLISPSDSTQVWGAPVSESVQVIKVGRIRQVTAQFIGTGPQPGPQVADL